MAILGNYYAHLYSNCPVVELRGYCARHKLPGSILAYLDFGGATGSAKDGLAEGMLALAAEAGLLKKGQPVVEASSGTFAVALTIAARHSGHPVTLTMPDSTPDERRQLLRGLGAQIVTCSPLEGRRGCERMAAEIAADEGGWFVNYFANDLNPEYHRRVTGPSILRQTGSDFDAVVIGVGSAGTVTGVGEYLRAWEPQIKVVAVEPYECQAIGGGFPGKHGIGGLGAGFVPENYNPYVVDRVVAVNTGEARRAAAEVLRADAIPACDSAGATLAAARLLLEKGQAKRPLCIFAGRQAVE